MAVDASAVMSQEKLRVGVRVRVRVRALKAGRWLAKKG